MSKTLSGKSGLRDESFGGRIERGERRAQRRGHLSGDLESKGLQTGAEDARVELGQEQGHPGPTCRWARSPLAHPSETATAVDGNHSTLDRNPALAISRGARRRASA